MTACFSKMIQNVHERQELYPACILRASEYASRKLNQWKQIVHYHPEEQDQYVMSFNGPEEYLIEIMAASALLCKHNEAK